MWKLLFIDLILIDFLKYFMQSFYASLFLQWNLIGILKKRVNDGKYLASNTVCFQFM